MGSTFVKIILAFLLLSLVRSFSVANHHVSRSISCWKLYNNIKIGLTRENGANSKLAYLIQDLQCVEIPCIDFAPGTDNSLLPQEISNSDSIVITSPQAADVFLTAWKQAGSPLDVQIATVGMNVCILRAVCNMLT